MSIDDNAADVQLSLHKLDEGSHESPNKDNVEELRGCRQDGANAKLSKRWEVSPKENGFLLLLSRNLS